MGADGAQEQPHAVVLDQARQIAVFALETPFDLVHSALVPEVAGRAAGSEQAFVAAQRLAGQRFDAVEIAEGFTKLGLGPGPVLVPELAFGCAIA